MLSWIVSLPPLPDLSNPPSTVSVVVSPLQWRPAASIVKVRVPFVLWLFSLAFFERLACSSAGSAFHGPLKLRSSFPVSVAWTSANWNVSVPILSFIRCVTVTVASLLVLPLAVPSWPAPVPEPLVSVPVELRLPPFVPVRVTVVRDRELSSECFVMDVVEPLSLLSECAPTLYAESAAPWPVSIVPLPPPVRWL